MIGLSHYSPYSGGSFNGFGIDNPGNAQNWRRLLKLGMPSRTRRGALPFVLSRLKAA
jgi:hypothetical protein